MWVRVCGPLPSILRSQKIKEPVKEPTLDGRFFPKKKKTGDFFGEFQFFLKTGGYFILILNIFGKIKIKSPQNLKL
jgi:hypothetical protein